MHKSITVIANSMTGAYGAPFRKGSLPLSGQFRFLYFYAKSFTAPELQECPIWIMLLIH